MKLFHYYIVEVSHFKGNPIYRTIVKCVFEDRNISKCEVKFICNEDYLRKEISKLNFFTIIKEITEMNKGED